MNRSKIVITASVLGALAGVIFIIGAPVVPIYRAKTAATSSKAASADWILSATTQPQSLNFRTGPYQSPLPTLNKGEEYVFTLTSSRTSTDLTQLAVLLSFLQANKPQVITDGQLRLTGIYRIGHSGDRALFQKYLEPIVKANNLTWASIDKNLYITTNGDLLVRSSYFGWKQVATMGSDFFTNFSSAMRISFSDPVTSVVRNGSVWIAPKIIPSFQYVDVRLGLRVIGSSKITYFGGNRFDLRTFQIL